LLIDRGTHRLILKLYGEEVSLPTIAREGYLDGGLARVHARTSPLSDTSLPEEEVRVL